MKCRNYDCKRDLGDFEVEKMAKLPYPLQSKYNYCVKCRRINTIIDRIQCHYCKCFMKYTTITKHVCKKCIKDRLKIRLHRNHVKRDGLYIPKTKLVNHMIEKGHTKLEIMKQLDITDNTLRVLMHRNKKKK